MRSRAASLILAVLVSGGCGDTTEEPPPFSPPGPGLIFSFPGHGQLDVPVEATVAVAFSEAIDTEVIGENCSPGNGTIAGGLCLQGPAGAVDGTWTVVGDGGRAAEFSPAHPLEPGTRYDLLVERSVLAAGVGNVVPALPAVTFVTRGGGPQIGVAPEVLVINGEDASVFSPGGSGPRFPFADFASLRLVFSEPIDTKTAVTGGGIELLDGSGNRVAGTILADGRHVTFDPTEDLNSGQPYELRVTAALLDRDGEAAAPQSYSLQPVATTTGDPPYPSVLDVDPGVGDQNYPEPSGVSRLPQNNVSLTSTLIGENRIEIIDGKLELSLAHPDLFETVVPVVIRRGQSLTASGLDVALGGVVPSGLGTGDIRLSFASDVTGFLVRNQFWPPSTIPDNDEAPLQAILTFDLAVSSIDPIGNAVLTQNVLGVQVTGIAEAEDGQLRISNVGVLSLNLLGIADAPATLALAMSTTTGESTALDTEPPLLNSSYPGAGEELAESTESILLHFNESVMLRDDTAATLQTDFNATIDADVQAVGSMIVISPREPLPADGGYRIILNGGITDLSGNRWQPQDADPSGGTSVVPFVTGAMATSTELPPLLVAVYPGAPCALEGQGIGNRHCDSGDGGDDDYLPFELPANHPIEVLFDKPVVADTLSLGADCGSGAVRVERVAGDACESAVPGTLSTSERGLRFVPAAPWTPGQTYRLVLRGGSNTTCAANEICGANFIPLNTNPLASPEDPGGPDAEFFFVGAEESSQAVAVTHTRPLADRNGNGRIDSGESPTSTNRAAIRLSGVTGLVTEATFAMEDCDAATAETEGCMYLSGDLVVRLGEPRKDCFIETASGTSTIPDCIPVDVTPSAIYGTQLTMDARILGLGLINDLETGKLVLRTREKGVPIRGFIIGDGAGKSELVVKLSTFMDAPDLSILGGLATHDLQSKELDVFLRGPVDFRDDGRLIIQLRNEEAISLDVEVRTIGINSGTMSMTIDEGAMAVDFVSRSARGGVQ